MELKVAGVDEAGRGSVLGPLVVAGVSIEQDQIPKLLELGVRDSKLLSPAKRKTLYREIKTIASSVVYEKIEPSVIDQVVLNGEKLRRLNYLEAKSMAKVLHNLKVFDVAFIDSCDTNQARYGNTVADLLLESKKSFKKKLRLGDQNPFRTTIKSEHHADRNYPVVSAASIIAKVTRDEAIHRLYKKHGKFGSGYPSDPLTLEFLKSFVTRSEEFPTFTRLSWATIARLKPSEVLPKL